MKPAAYIQLEAGTMDKSVAIHLFAKIALPMSLVKSQMSIESTKLMSLDHFREKLRCLMLYRLVQSLAVLL